VLVNPIQSLHPNMAARADSSLVDSGRRAGFDKAAYGAWLKEVRAVCTERGIALIFDEVFLGFRLAPGGAQEYFDVRADLVTYGKTLGGGLPIGVVCGRREFMKRYRDDRPADICFARGTFNSHPYVMGAMHEFLIRLDTPEIRKPMRCGTNVRGASTAALPTRGCPSAPRTCPPSELSATASPRAITGCQYYLRAEGLALSWIGTGRIIFRLNYTEQDFEAVANRFVAAARAMHGDGWWWGDARSKRPIKRQILREMIRHALSGRGRVATLEAGPQG
jgi:glutamate-1-semialdehyde 2,1-aminomutase